VIGAKIAEARKMAGMKQADLSETLLYYGVDINPQALSKWEKGNVMPNAYQLLAVSYALGISNPLEFFTGTAPAVAQELNKKGLAVLDEFKRFLVSSGKYEIHQAVQNVQEM
jgi:transcriptional regulator with XRE-family HTH domain